MICMQLTDEQKSALLIQGWTVAAGPFATEEGCLAACQEAGTSTMQQVQTTCCVETIDSGLTVTFLGCITGSVEIDYSVDRWSGSGLLTCGSGSLPVAVELACEGSGWSIDVNGACKAVADEAVCSPLVIEFALDGTCIASECSSCATSSFSAIVTKRAP